MKFYSLFLFSVLSFSAISQEYANPNYYLVDSLDFKELDKADSLIIEEQLVIYHSDQHDTSRFQALSKIIEGIKHPIWEKFNDVHFDLTKKALDDKNVLSSKEIKNFYLQHGAAVNNKGYSANREGQTWKAISLFKEAVELFRLSGDSASVSRGFIGLSSAYHNVGEIALSNQMDQSTLAIAKTSNDIEILVIGHKNLAMKLMMNNYLDEALENALLAV